MVGLKQYKTTLAIALIPVLALGLAIGLSAVPWLGPDWENIYRPAALAARPNDVRGNFAPPWIYWTLWPIAALPDALSKGVLTVATIVICRLYIGNWHRFIALCVTMPFLATLTFGQVDALALIGLMVPADLSLLFLSMKPQSAALATFKKRLTPWSVSSLLIALVVSFMLCGWWPTALLSRGQWGTDCSPWPWGIPFGLILLAWQWKRGFPSDAMLCLATLLLSPYFFYTSMLPATATMIKELDDDWLSIATVIVLTWLFVFIARVGL